jgi:hypothetical protein
MKNKKLTAMGILCVFALSGCTSNKQEPEMYDLLHRDSSNMVYKSITIEDYKAEDVCSS